MNGFILGVYNNEQRFTAPGTWTCPATTTWVQVTVVGGGGGSGALIRQFPISPGQGSGAGGGGAVRVQTVPVSAPVPITVGAGGAGGITFTWPAGTPTLVMGQAGGISAFGPLGPGPVPAIPPSTIAAGGGGGGSSQATGSSYGIAAPPIGGGAGGSVSTVVGMRGGIYGSPAQGLAGGGAGGMDRLQLQFLVNNSGFGPGPGSFNTFGYVPKGIEGFGGGGTGGWANPISRQPNTSVIRGRDGGGSASVRRQNPPSGPYTFGPAEVPGGAVANSGGGGGALITTDPIFIPVPAPTNYTNGYPGAAGIVIVRWNE